MGKNKKIRIFMVGYSHNKGGVEAYISNLVGSMDNTKFEIIYKMPEMVIDGKKWIAPLNRHNYIKYRLFWRKFFSENKFDVLYLNTCDVVSIDDLKFAKRAGIPVRIIHAHNTGNQRSIGTSLSLFHQLSEKMSRNNLEKFATHFFACSKSAGDWMFDGREYRVIKNGINLSNYQFSNSYRIDIKEKNSIMSRKTVGIIGRLSPQKNPLFSVGVLESLLNNKDDFYAVFIGDGEMRAEIQQQIIDKGLDNKVQLIGAVDNVNEWLSAVDCVLMPSLFEGLPFVLVEAQAAGLHCVVSSAVSQEANITGLVEFVSLDEDKETWAKKVLDACEQPRVDVSQKLTDAGYSIEDTAKTVSEIIENMLNNQRKS